MAFGIQPFFEGAKSRSLSGVPSNASTRTNVLILVNETIYASIVDRLAIFEQDLALDGYIALVHTISNGLTPPEIRDNIRSHYIENNISGCILMGDVKAAYSEIRTGDYSNSSTLKIWVSLDAADMYYMDLDGYWENVTHPDFYAYKPSNVVQVNLYPSCQTFYNEYIVYLNENKKWDYSTIENKTQYRAEIWVSRIMGHNLGISGKNETEIINEFLDWDHAFRANQRQIEDRAYLLNAGGPGYNDQNMDYSSIFNSTTKKENVTKSDYLDCLNSPDGSKLIYLTAHSWPQGHSLYDGSLTVDELSNSNKSSVFYVLNACSACRWDQYVSSPTSPNYLGGIYVFQKDQNEDYGIGAIGFTGVGGFNWLEFFTDYLKANSNASYGEAYKYWFNENLMRIFGTTNYVYLGDPTIGPKTPMVKPPSLSLLSPEMDGLTATINGVTLPGNPHATVARINWNWGDGCSEDHWFPANHTYIHSGNYTVTVTSYQSDGLSTSESMVVEAKRNANSFRFVKVTLLVKNVEGTPINNAQVKAFSEDWGFRVPNFQFNQTDANGTITFSLPIGNWSFFAWGGWDFVNSNRGQGYFVVLRYVAVNSDIQLTLQPSSFISISFFGLEGQPLLGDVRILDSNHIPIVQSPIAGRTDENGKITMKVTSGIYYDLLFSSQNATVGYGVLQNGIGSGSNITFQATNDSLSHIILNVFDKNFASGHGWFSVNYDCFNVGENTGLAPVNFEANRKLDFYSTASLITIAPCLTYGSWCYRFIPYDYNLTAGSTYEISFGGALSPKLWVQEEQTQVWISICDSFGNLLDWFWNDGIPNEIPITLTRNGTQIYTGAIDSFFDFLGMSYDATNSPEYRIDLDMGPYGTYNLTGTLLSNYTLLPIRTIHTEHLDVEVPDVGGQVAQRFDMMSACLEEMYQAESSALEEYLPHRTIIAFQIDIICGQAWSNHVGMAIGFPLGSSYATIPSTFIGVASHELGHVFQLSPPVSPPGYYIDPWFGEPYGTLIGNVAMEKILGDRLAFFDRGSHDYFYYYLKTGRLNNQLIENIQFVLYYIESEYGLQVPKRFNQLWTSDTAVKNLLTSKGFSTNETIVTLLSYASGDDLGWIFNLAGLNISEERVAQGLILLSDRIPPATSDNYDGAWYNADFTITLAASDSVSGVAATYYRVNGGSIKRVGIDGQPRISSEGANNTLEYWSLDNVGNEELPHKILAGMKLDKTPPTGSLLINGNATYVNSTSATLTISANDTVSGLAKMRFGNDSITWTTWETYNVSRAWTLTSGDGAKTVYCQFMDNAGLASSVCTDSIVLDTAGPIVETPPRKPEEGVQPDQSVTISVNASDLLSDVRSVRLTYNVNNSALWLDFPMIRNTTTGFFEYTIPGQQANTIVKYKVTAYDDAENSVTNDNTGQYYVYTVVPEFPSLIVVALFMMATLLGVVVYRRKYCMRHLTGEIG
jgi:hypothetical protein